MWNLTLRFIPAFSMHVVYILMSCHTSLLALFMFSMSIAFDYAYSLELNILLHF